MTEIPEYYFRVRENGAVVFRVETENRMRRIEMQQIAVVNVRNGEIKAHGTQTLSDQDRTRIEAWLADRRETLHKRDLDDIERTIDRLNLTAAWAQQTATGDELNAVSDRLLMAMHDLRMVLVRKKSQQKDGSD
ncbi:MAG: hypothetical protein ACU0GG_15145 [Paracoccaceae bacterium]